jgi:malate dehydrogenase
MHTHKSPLHVAVTGAAGAIGYSILFRLATGEVFGHNQPLILHLIDIEPMVPVMGGVVLELEDCASPVLRKVIATADLEEGFCGVDWALLIGSVPRQPGMERKDLLAINGKIFTGQGRALQKHAARDLRVVVVGNPCNTNCLIAMNSAPEIAPERWFAMTRLDENRAKAQLARKAGVGLGTVSNLGVWGNHSPTMFPDFYNARINGQPVPGVIPDENWLQTEFVTTVAQRGTAVLNARKSSSAASAASAAMDTVKSIINPTAHGDWHSLCVCSDGSYGIEKGLICSFPVRSDGRTLQIVPGIELNDFSRAKITASVEELKGEKAIAAELGLLK